MNFPSWIPVVIAVLQAIKDNWDDCILKILKHDKHKYKIVT